MYILDQTLFYPLLGYEFFDVKLEVFSPASLCKRYGNPTSVLNLEDDLNNKCEKSILKNIINEKPRFQYLIADSLSFLGKFMIFDWHQLENSIAFYKENSRSDMYRSKVFIDGTDLMFVNTNLQSAFAIDHEFNLIEFQTS